MIGTWLDGLTDVERDRVIAAQDWQNGHWGDVDGRCLVGHACPRLVLLDDTYIPKAVWDVAFRFDALYNRFGKDRVVRAIKARAAKRNRISLAVPTEAAR